MFILALAKCTKSAHTIIGIKSGVMCGNNDVNTIIHGQFTDGESTIKHNLMMIEES